ncbi:hypothetical protein PO909_029296 [Leuciscus waleckii]
MRRNQNDLLLVLPDLAQGLCKKAHWGKRILAEAPWPAVCQCISAECALGQGIKQAAMRRVVGGKQIYLCVAELFPNQLNRLGMESPFSRKRLKL